MPAIHATHPNGMRTGSEPPLEAAWGLLVALRGCFAAAGIGAGPLPSGASELWLLLRAMPSGLAPTLRRRVGRAGTLRSRRKAAARGDSRGAPATDGGLSSALVPAAPQVRSTDEGLVVKPTTRAVLCWLVVRTGGGVQPPVEWPSSESIVAPIRSVHEEERSGDLDIVASSWQITIFINLTDKLSLRGVVILWGGWGTQRGGRESGDHRRRGYLPAAPPTRRRALKSTWAGGRLAPAPASRPAAFPRRRPPAAPAPAGHVTPPAPCTGA